MYEASTFEVVGELGRLSRAFFRPYELHGKMIGKSMEKIKDTVSTF
jgi:hypothetical protein